MVYRLVVFLKYWRNYCEIKFLSGNKYIIERFWSEMLDLSVTKKGWRWLSCQLKGIIIEKQQSLWKLPPCQNKVTAVLVGAARQFCFFFQVRKFDTQNETSTLATMSAIIKQQHLCHYIPVSSIGIRGDSWKRLSADHYRKNANQIWELSELDFFHTLLHWIFKKKIIV